MNALKQDLGRADVEAQCEVALALQEVKKGFASADFATLQQKEKVSRMEGEMRKARGMVVVAARDNGGSFGFDFAPLS